MKTEDIHRVAHSRFNDWKSGKTFTQLAGPDKPANMGEAYAIQSALYDLMRQKDNFTEFGGHKVALTSPAIQEMCGVSEPAYGAIFKEFIYGNGHEVEIKDFIRFGIEFEVAIELREDVPLIEVPYTKETIAKYLGAAMPAFELIDDRDADYSMLDAASILTDRCWCNGIVLGEVAKELDIKETGNLNSAVLVNGKMIDRGNTGAALGHPLNSVAFVANHLASYEKQLKAGEIVMTGSALKTLFLKPGDNVTYQIEKLGSVSVDLKSD